MMSVLRQGSHAIKRIVFGDTLLPQEFTIGLAEPQSEISVWLHGMGLQPYDVTRRCTTACSDPLILCVALPDGKSSSHRLNSRFTLKFCERNGEALGEIYLALSTVIPVNGLNVMLFSVRGSANYCLPKLRGWLYHRFCAYERWRRIDHSSGLKMTFLEECAAMVTFIRPHPLALGSLIGEAGGNIFPMNLMGDLGDGYFGFALKDSRLAAHLVERTGRLALSSVPLEQSSIAYPLAVNHTKHSIDWNELPFTVKKTSAIFHIPVPDFSPRVRELEVDSVHKTGSHTFFIARIVSDEGFSDVPLVNVIHGTYQFRRLKGENSKLKAAVAEDSFNKRGPARAV